jgi:hypothetical protein
MVAGESWKMMNPVQANRYVANGGGRGISGLWYDRELSRLKLKIEHAIHK